MFSTTFCFCFHRQSPGHVHESYSSYNKCGKRNVFSLQVCEAAAAAEAATRGAAAGGSGRPPGPARVLTVVGLGVNLKIIQLYSF